MNPRHLVPAPALAWAVLALACNRSTSESSPATTGITSVADASPSETASSSDSTTRAADDATSPDASATSSGGPEDPSHEPTDLGSAPDLGSAVPAGCAGKLDVVFILERSAGTWKYQQKAIPAALKFFGDIAADFPDLHILVTDTDDLWGAWLCDHELCSQSEENGCLPDGPADYPCGEWLHRTDCDLTLGAGIVFPAGYDASNKPCPIPEGRRYLRSGDPDLAEALGCLMLVGDTGEGRTGDTIVATVSPELNAPSGCNAGFLRPDALLAFIIIAGQDASQVYFAAPAWLDAVRAAKGDLSEVAALLLTHDGGPPDGFCTADYENSKMRKFTAGLTHAVDGSFCAPSYLNYFSELAAVLDDTCAAYVPG